MTKHECAYHGSQIQLIAYKKLLEEELKEGIIEITTKENVKWWNPTFLVPKPNGEWRKILDAKQLNKEIV